MTEDSWPSWTLIAGIIGGHVLGSVFTYLAFQSRYRSKRKSMGDKKIKVYHYRTFRSSRIAWLVEEMGISQNFEFITFNPMTVPPEELTWYKENVHPHGTVPALVDSSNNKVMLESGAACLYLAQYDNRFLPDDDMLADYYDWSVYAVSTADLHLVTMEKFVFGSQEEQDQIGEKKYQKARNEISVLIRRLDKHLDKRKFICGDRFTAVDVIIGYCIMWASVFKGGELLSDYPKSKDYLTRLKKRRAFAPSMGTTREWLTEPEY